MPFDGTVSNPSVLVVDRMIYMLSDSNHWIKNRLKAKNSDDMITGACLVGALQLAVTPLPKRQRRAAGKPVYLAMNVVINRVTHPKTHGTAKRLARFGLMPQALIMQFNDDSTTTHRAVMELLRETRAQLAITALATV